MINLLTVRIKLNLLFNLSYQTSNFTLTLGYLNPVLNNPAQLFILSFHVLIGYFYASRSLVALFKICLNFVTHLLYSFARNNLCVVLLSQISETKEQTIYGGLWGRGGGGGLAKCKKYSCNGKLIGKKIHPRQVTPSLLAADVFPVVASLPPKNNG